MGLVRETGRWAVAARRGLEWGERWVGVADHGAGLEPIAMTHPTDNWEFWCAMLAGAYQPHAI